MSAYAKPVLRTRQVSHCPQGWRDGRPRSMIIHAQRCGNEKHCVSHRNVAYLADLHNFSVLRIVYNRYVSCWGISARWDLRLGNIYCRWFNRHAGLNPA